MKDKKAYEKPGLRKVRLEVKHAVLSTCHTSTIDLNKTPLGCNMDPTCLLHTP